MDSKASNLSCSEESKHIEMVLAVLNNRRIWQKYVKLSLLKRLFQNKWEIVRRGAPAASRSKVIRYTVQRLMTLNDLRTLGGQACFRLGCFAMACQV
ncbi:hypothetical protein CTI12_AA408940 [Artemisia annua]|uniref:Uncharacterized protein n=1 Tax=Artemisia annua TaxID=35608 RepID=A0A2U1M783_ARTAN|nr:hypothetical protein CTI12_AA408940 [Artemisia annua]